MHAHSALHTLLAWRGLGFRIRFSVRVGVEVWVKVGVGITVRDVLELGFWLGLGFALHAHSNQHALLAHSAVAAHSPLHALLAHSALHGHSILHSLHVNSALHAHSEIGRASCRERV